MRLVAMQSGWRDHHAESVRIILHHERLRRPVDIGHRGRVCSFTVTVVTTAASELACTTYHIEALTQKG